MKIAAKQLVSFLFEWLAAENFWMHSFSEIFQNFFRIFSEISEKILKIFWKFSEKNLKKFWNSSKFKRSNAKSLNIAAKQLVSFIFEWLAAENLWIQKFFRNISEIWFRIFSENFQKKIKTLIYRTLLDWKLSIIGIVLSNMNWGISQSMKGKPFLTNQ